MAEISIAPEVLGEIGHFPVTNTLVTALLASLVLITLALVTRRKLSLVPGTFQTMVEVVVGGVYDFIQSILEDKKTTRKYFPFIVTIFLFFLTSNLLAYVPGLGALHFESHGHAVHLFRIATSDYNTIFAITILSFFVVQISSFSAKGALAYLGQFFNFSSPINFAIGLLELVGEVARIVSLSARLFGNIFAEEVLTLVITLLAPFIAPIPFNLLGLAPTLIQPVVFSLLVLIFLKLGMQKGHH